MGVQVTYSLQDLKLNLESTDELTFKSHFYEHLGKNIENRQYFLNDTFVGECDLSHDGIMQSDDLWFDNRNCNQAAVNILKNRNVPFVRNN